MARTRFLQETHSEQKSRGLQNLILGEVYGGKKLKHRVPVDPKKRTISLENYEDLKKHFKEKHPLGQEQDRLVATIKEQLKNAPLTVQLVLTGYKEV